MTFLGLSNKSIQDSNLSSLTIEFIKKFKKKKKQLEVNYEFGYYRRWKIKMYSKHLREICKAKILIRNST